MISKFIEVTGKNQDLPTKCPGGMVAVDRSPAWGYIGDYAKWWIKFQPAIGHMRLMRLPLALLMMGFAFVATAQNWSPKRPVEIVVGFASGGSQDLTARAVERLLVTNKLVSAPIAVVNKPGASGGIAYAYVSQRPADGHTLMVAGTSMISGHILGTSVFNHTEFTPIASLFNDYIAFSVHPDAPLHSGRDLAERLRKDAKSVSVGVVSIGSGAHVSALLLNKVLGGSAKDLRVVSFKAGTEVMANLLGGHIDIGTNTAVVTAPHVASKRVRVVAVAAPRRLDGALASIPTWTEQGVNVIVSNWRAIFGPKAMGAAQITYWQDALRNVTESAEWKAELEKNFWVGDFTVSAQFRRDLARDYAGMKAVFVELGLAK